jgi:hypothetical protein
MADPMADPPGAVEIVRIQQELAASAAAAPAPREEETANTGIERLLDANEHDLRMSWWLSHGCQFGALYGDDGEMQCNACCVDFKRMTGQEIAAALKNARMRRSRDRRDGEADSELVKAGCALIHRGAEWTPHALNDLVDHGATTTDFGQAIVDFLRVAGLKMRRNAQGYVEFYRDAAIRAGRAEP